MVAGHVDRLHRGLGSGGGDPHLRTATTQKCSGRGQEKPGPRQSLCSCGTGARARARMQSRRPSLLIGSPCV